MIILIVLDIESVIIFKPNVRNDGLPSCDIRGFDMLLAKKKIGRQVNFIKTMLYIMFKLPDSKPGLIFGIIPIDVFDSPLEIYKNPLT